MEGTMSEIRFFGGDFAPKTWATCQGQTLAINTNQALFSLLGTTYGGNGVTTFCLPDLRGRAAVGPGQGAGLPTVTLGEVAGANNVTMLTQQMPMHVHAAACQIAVPAYSQAGNVSFGSTSSVLAGVSLYSTETPDTIQTQFNLTPVISTAGGSQPFPIIQPSLGLTVIICTQGIYPSRN